MSRSAADISAPEKLVADHDLADFDSGEPALDDWLRRRALANEESGSWGIIASPIDPMTVMIAVAEAVKTLSEKTEK